MKNEQMNEIAKKNDNILVVLRMFFIFVTIATAFACLLWTITDLNNPDPEIGKIFYSVEIGPLTIEFTEGVKPDKISVLNYNWIKVATLAAITAVICYAISVTRRIFSQILQGNLFSPSISKELRRLAFASLAIGIIQNIMNMIRMPYLLHILDMNTLLQNSKVQSMTMNRIWDVGFIVVFIFCL